MNRKQSAKGTAQPTTRSKATSQAPSGKRLVSWLALAGVLGAVAVAALLVVRELRENGPSPEVASPSLRVPAAPVGAAAPKAGNEDTATYRFRLAHDSLVEVVGAVARAGTPPVNVETRIRLEGTMNLAWVGHEAGRQLVLLAFTGFQQHDFTVNRQSLFESPAIVQDFLLKPRALLVLEAGGRPVEVRTAQNTPPPFVRLVQLVMGELQFALPEQRPSLVQDQTGEAPDTWQAQELSALGDVDVVYRRLGREGELDRIVKERTNYSNLRPLQNREALAPTQVVARAEFSVDEKQRLESFSGREDVEVKRRGVRVLLWSMEIEAYRVTEGDAFLPHLVVGDFNQRQAFGAVEVSERGEAHHLAQRIGDMTRERMLQDLRQFGAAGHMPDHNAWAWKVTGLLRKEPEIIQELLVQFYVPAIGTNGRALIVDLLAGAGTPEAQAALRAILEAKDRLDGKEWRRHLQALGLLQEPSAETLAFIAKTYDESKGMDRYASALAAGAVVHQGIGKSDDREATALGDRLLQDFQAAQDENERVRLLGALGNAGVTSHLPVLLANRNDPSPSIRSKTAYALRKLDHQEARATLVALSGDDNYSVAVQAVNTLGRLTIGEEEISGLHARVMKNEVPPEAFPGLVNALSPHARHELVRQILLRIAAHPRTFNDLRARCRSLLGH